MFGIFKKDIRYKELPLKERFEKIIREFVEPRLKPEGFDWKKEETIPDEELKFMEEYLKRKLKGADLYYPHKFIRKRGDFKDIITLARFNNSSDKLWFSINWHLESEAYENWHASNFDEHPTNGEFAMEDNGLSPVDKRYMSSESTYYYYDLSKYDTPKVMDAALENDITRAISKLGKLDSWDKILESRKKLNDPYVYESMVDICLMKKDTKNAARILKWAEECFKKEDPSWERDEDFNKRLKRIKEMV